MDKARWWLIASVLVLGAVLGVMKGPVAGDWFVLMAALIGTLVEAIGFIVRRRRLDHVHSWSRAGGVLAWLALLLVAWWVGPTAAREQDDLRARICVAYVKDLSRALAMYSSDHGGVLPSDDRWADLVAVYVRDRRSFVCPEAQGLSSGYAYNSAVSARKLRDLQDPGNTILLFESDGGWNAAGGAQLLPPEPRHYRHGSGAIDIYGFADGNVQRHPRRRLPEGTWAKDPDVDWVIWELAAEEREGAGTQAGSAQRTVLKEGTICDALAASPLATYTVVRWFCVRTWGWPHPAFEVLLTGDREHVDQQLGPWAFPWPTSDGGIPGLGPAVEGPCFGLDECRYRDHEGVRLVGERHEFFRTLILTSKGSGTAELVDVDLGALRTDAGIGLGDSEEGLRERLGPPSRADEDGPYVILWYFGRPTHETEEAPDRDWDWGNAAAYALENDAIVEIWLHWWSTEACGG